MPQSQRLVMIGVGLQSDAPSVPIQPRLDDGVHLRWATRRDLAFPWFGFFLYRRASGDFESVCVSAQLRQFQPGETSERVLVLPGIASFESDLPLVLIDDFFRAGTPEISLSSIGDRVRQSLRCDLPAGRIANQVDVRVGFRRPGRRASMRLTAMLGGVRVAESVATGNPGSTVRASVLADGIDSVVLSGIPGPGLPDAALVELCYVDVDATAGLRWEPVPNCPQPITLPLTHPDYPATSNQPADEAAARAMAVARISYGPVAPFDQNFAELHAQLIRLVEGGPGGPAIEDPRRAVTQAGQYIPAEPDLKAPSITALHPLDLVNLASLHPAVAQMLGLYWLDATAIPGQLHDYLIVAELDGASGRDPDAALQLWRASSASVEGYIVSNLGVGPAPPLPPPGDVRAYALSGATVAAPAGAGAQDVKDATLVAGVRWRLPEGAPGILLARSPVLYHLWREGRGNGALPAAINGPGDHITSNGPVLIAWRTGSPFSVPQWPADWPPFSLQRLDRPPAEGWYSYRVSGMDLFGRVSPMAPPAPWYQWAPMPIPRPYYYQDPEGDRAIHPDAVQILDRTPPPSPAAVEAWALDPKDPFVIRDAAYNAWRTALPQAVSDTLVGLRVRWRWTGSQIQQAPDTSAFRIYFNLITFPPGSPPAPPSPVESDLVDSTYWAERIHVTAFADDVTVQAEDRVYEVLMPRADTPMGIFPNGVPLDPSPAEPVAYAFVGVSAVDQSGNESRVSSPAKVARAFRQSPVAPEAVPDSERVFATSSDYHDRSYYTFRWRPQAHLRTHVCRAMDESIFALDWARRPADPVSPDDVGIFPNSAAEPRWTPERRQEVADEINAIAEFPRTEEGRLLALARYHTLSNDALRVLASLPGVAAAFTQITTVPLDPDDRANANRRGAENPADFAVDPDLRAYVDTLDGRATNRYFYRALYVDGANNLSLLSISGPPVWLPNVTPPRMPSLQGVLGGDGRIEITWAANREPDLDGYRVYRTATAEAARDIRSMDLVDTLQRGAVEPSARQPITWADEPLPGLTPFYYRITAVDDAGNESAPTPYLVGRATDTAPPEPPTMDSAEWIRLAPGGNEVPFVGADPNLPAAVRVRWTASTPDCEYLTQRRTGPTELWRRIASWRPATTVLDDSADVALDYEYRVLARKPTNKMTSASDPLAATGSATGR
jgi:hypothetical protein